MDQVLFDGELHVHYGQMYVMSSDDAEIDLHDCFTGQSNGLCGAAAPGELFLITGLHTGNVAVTVERHDAEPALDDSWEDVVEASFTPVSAEISLVEWAGQAAWSLELDPIAYRVRYCATGMDEAHDADTRLDGEPLLDRYLLQFWPRTPAPDRVVKQTSQLAAYWHGFASGLPPAPTPAEHL